MVSAIIWSAFLDAFCFDVVLRILSPNCTYACLKMVFTSVTGYQYISSAAAYNFGYKFRANWFRNFVFVFFFTSWTAFQFAATLTNSKFSCIWRLNCDNDHVVRLVYSAELEAIYNVFNTTVMPMSFRWLLVGLMIINLIAICAWDYYVVNMALPKFGTKMGMQEDSQHVTQQVQFALPQEKEIN